MCVEILLLLSTSKCFVFFIYLQPGLHADDASNRVGLELSGFCLAFPGRQALRNRGAYFVVRELHKVEADQQVGFVLYPIESFSYGQQIKTAIERLVSLVHGEEGHDTRNEGVRELVRARRGALGDVEVMGESDVIEV